MSKHLQTPFLPSDYQSPIPMSKHVQNPNPSPMFGFEILRELLAMENIVIDSRVTRSGSKRAAAEEYKADSPPKKKNRIVLAEIPNKGNMQVSSGVGLAIEAKRMRTKKSESVVAVEVAEEYECGGVGMVCESVAADVGSYLRSLESKRRPLADFLKKVQRDLTPGMRAILIDWLAEVAEDFRLSSTTLHLSVSYIDIFLSRDRGVDREILQLVGVCCLLIASKYEEIDPPPMVEFACITDNTYSTTEVKEMESDILRVLNWEVGNPTAMTFLWTFVTTGENDSNVPRRQLVFLSSYLAELSLLDYECVKFPPSMIAASAVFAAKYTLNPNVNPWNSNLHRCTGYKPSDLMDCVLCIYDHQLNNRYPKLSVIRNKYKNHKFMSVSTLLPPCNFPSSYFEDADHCGRNSHLKDFVREVILQV